MTDLRALRADFPILAREVNGSPLVYLDSAATTQKPIAVLDAMQSYYENSNANVHRGAHTLAAEATELYEDARGKVARFIGSSPSQLAFVRGTTTAIVQLPVYSRYATIIPDATTSFSGLFGSDRFVYVALCRGTSGTIHS